VRGRNNLELSWEAAQNPPDKQASQNRPETLKARAGDLDNTTTGPARTYSTRSSGFRLRPLIFGLLDLFELSLTYRAFRQRIAV